MLKHIVFFLLLICLIASEFLDHEIPRRPPYPGIPPIPSRPSRPEPNKKGLAVYEDYNWEVVKGNSEEDNHLRSTWDTPKENILDLALVMDLTGSMGPWIENTKDTLKQVIDTVVQSYPDLEVRVAFVGYRDFPDNDIFTIHDFTFDLAKMKSYISGLRARGGADHPEDVAGGLYQLLNLSWHPDSTKLANLVADAPSHGEQYHSGSDSHPQGSPAGLELEDLVKQIRAKDISFTCYKLDDSTEQMYSKIKETYGEGGVFTFVDMRGILQQNALLGHHSSSSDFVKHSYAAANIHNIHDILARI